VDLERYEKGNPRDFTLLKRSTLSELKKGIFFQTQWGNVRPSWHLECPVMAHRFFGDTHDIQTGGVDLIFPHHENAIAISRAVTGRPPANFWIHHELVMVEGKKPVEGKQADPYAIRNLIQKGYTGREIRYWLISHHHNKPLSFSYPNWTWPRKPFPTWTHSSKSFTFAPEAPFASRHGPGCL
jgi:cysteinyl-tRNA synthetase